MSSTEGLDARKRNNALSALHSHAQFALLTPIPYQVAKWRASSMGKYFPKKAIKETSAVGLSARGVHLRASIHHATRLS
jgi:hypothetical protein